jgi:hypothetical protein
MTPDGCTAPMARTNVRRTSGGDLVGYVGQPVLPAAFPADSGAGPRPVFRRFHQSRSHGIPLHIRNCCVVFLATPDPMIVRLILPERPAPIQNAIGTPSGRSFQPVHDGGQLLQWQPDHMDVIRHDHEGVQPIHSTCCVAVEYGLCYHAGNSRIRQPYWSGGAGKRAGESPGDEEGHIVREPMWQSSVVVGHSPDWQPARPAAPLTLRSCAIALNFSAK